MRFTLPVLLTAASAAATAWSLALAGDGELPLCRSMDREMERQYVEEVDTIPPPDPSRTIFTAPDLAVEAAFDASGSVILATAITLDGAPGGEIVGVDLRDDTLGLSMSADLAATDIVPLKTARRTRRSPRIGIGVGVGGSQRRAPLEEGPASRDNGGISGAVGVDLGAIFERKSGVDALASVWSLPAADFESQDPEHWSLAITRRNKNGESSETTMPAPQPPPSGEPTSACPGPSNESDTTEDSPGSSRVVEMTMTIVEAEGNVTVQRPGSDRWRRPARNDDGSFKDYDAPLETVEGETSQHLRIQTGLDSRAVVCLRGVDEAGREFAYELYVSPTSQITFTSMLVPDWAFLYGEERRIAIEKDREATRRLMFGGITQNVTRDVRRTDMRVDTPNCGGGVAG
jgi:hypothetical protein